MSAELDLRRQGLEEDRALADLRLEDARKALKQGFVTKKEVDALQWERDKLEYSARLLRLDSLLVRNRIDALVALNGKNKDGP